MIGINKYIGSQWKDKSLSSCEKDVLHLSEILKEKHGFETAILTENCSRKSILDFLHSSFKNKMNSNGRLIVYFAGHGDIHNKTHYLIPYDCGNITIHGIKTSDFIQS